MLDRRAALQRYTAREGNDAIDNQIALADTTAALAAIAQRQLIPCRIALSFAVRDPVLARTAEAAERLDGLLRGQGFETVHPSSPGFLPSLAVTPGGAPLGRSLQLTSDSVAACLVPALGTPFADQRQPLIGINQLTGAPAYLSIWSWPNHNAVIVGSSGSGKSVAAKTMLVRHVMEGASAVVIDPDLEYRRVMNSIGGLHFELGEDALNPLAPGCDVAPDLAASLLLPVLSVMAGDEKGVKDGRPIRRLPDEDQGWVHGEIAAFFREWNGKRPEDEPVIHDLVAFIETTSATQALTRRERDRCRVITARLRRFTQGDRASVFDRPSTFRVGDRPVSIGLRTFALTYAADLTPALAVVLTAVLARLGRDHRRLIVVVDEAHRITIDPDAGEVLGQPSGKRESTAPASGCAHSRSMISSAPTWGERLSLQQRRNSFSGWKRQRSPMSGMCSASPKTRLQQSIHPSRDGRSSSPAASAPLSPSWRGRHCSHLPTRLRSRDRRQRRL